MDDTSELTGGQLQRAEAFGLAVEHLEKSSTLGASIEEAVLLAEYILTGKTDDILGVKPENHQDDPTSVITHHKVGEGSLLDPPDMCDLCAAPRMIGPDGAHHCGSQEVSQGEALQALARGGIVQKSGSDVLDRALGIVRDFPTRSAEGLCTFPVIEAEEVPGLDDPAGSPDAEVLDAVEDEEQ